MNDDSYVISLKRDNGKLGFLFPIMSVTALIILIVLINVIPLLFLGNYIFFTLMISLGLIFLEVKLVRSLKVEYEIEINGDNVSVGKIIDGKKRDDLAEFSLRQCEFIGPVTADEFKYDSEKSDFVLNCTSKRNIEMDEAVWFFYVPENSYKYTVVFEFDAQMYPIVRRYNAHRTYSRNMRG